MAKNVIIDMKINTKDGEKSIGKVNAEGKILLTTMGELEEASARINEQLKGAEIGSEEYKKFSKELINVNTELKNQELALEALDHEQVASEIKSVVGGLTDMAGGMVLVGVSNESMEKVVQTFAQVEGVSKIATGAMEGYNSMMKLQGTISKVTTGWTNALAAAQLKGGITAKLASVGMAILNAVMALNPILLIVVALAALVAGLAWFMSGTNEAAEAQENLNKKLEENKLALEASTDASRKKIQFELDILNAKGASEDELHKKRLEALADVEKTRTDSMMNEYVFQSQALQNWRIAKKEKDAEAMKSIAAEIAVSKTKYDKLKSQNLKYNRAVQVENTKYNKIVADAADADVVDDESANKTKLDNYKKYNDNRLIAAKIIEDLKQNLGGDEISANNLKYDRLIADTKRNEKLKGEEKKKIIEGYEIQRGIAELKITSDKKKKDEDAEKAKNDAILNSLNREKELHSKIAIIQAETIQQEELNVASSEEEKIAIRKRFAQKLIDLQKEDLITQRDILLTNTKLTENERLKIISETNLEIKRLDEIEIADRDVSNIERNQFLLDQAIILEQAISSAVAEIQSRRHAASIEKIGEQFDTESASLKASLNNREISQKEFDAKMAMANDKKAEAEKKARLKSFKEQKAMALADVAMKLAGTIMGIQLNAAANPTNAVTFGAAGITQAAILTAVAVGTSAIQAAMIASQKFKGNRGGLVPGTASKKDSVDAELAPGEAVINSESSMMFPQLLSQINQAGGGVSLAPEPVPTLTGGGGGNIFEKAGNQMIQAFVVESQMTNTQKRVGRMERSAEF